MGTKFPSVLAGKELCLETKDQGHIRPSRSNLVNTIFHELLKQSRWNLQWITTSYYMFNLFRICRDDEISFDIVAQNGNNVEATFDFVERIVRLVAFDNVASTLLLVWTWLNGAAGRPGAWAVGRPTLHGGPVRLRTARATPTLFYIRHRPFSWLPLPDVDDCYNWR